MKVVAFLIGILFLITLSVAKTLNGQPEKYENKFLYQPNCGSSNPIRRKTMTKNIDKLLYGTQPWLVNIYLQEHLFFSETKYISRKCSGIIISEDWILSAAYCFEPSGYRLHSVLFLGNLPQIESKMHV